MTGWRRIDTTRGGPYVHEHTSGARVVSVTMAGQFRWRAVRADGSVVLVGKRPRHWRKLESAMAEVAP